MKLLSAPPALVGIAAFSTLSIACPEHTIARDIAGAHLATRADSAPSVNWTYDASYNWHTLSPEWLTCQTGTQQSPIGLKLDQGLSASHAPAFTFPGNGSWSAAGTYKNWGYGPAWDASANLTKDQLPTMRWDDRATYMAGWHIHSPADHSAGGDRSKAELHIVWKDMYTDLEAAVTGIRLDPGRANSTFFDQFSGFDELISYTDSTTKISMELDFGMLLGDEKHYGLFNEFWTYEGSLTSPPCKEGIRWFVARNIHWMNNWQMQRVLATSTYSARVEQEVWMHGVNQ